MPAVFITYRQLDATQKQRVRRFAERLRSYDVDVVLDQFFQEENPGGSGDTWAKWSSDQAINAVRILIIASDAWFRCYDGKEKPGTGLGAACEARVIRQRIYDQAGVNRFVRVAFFDESDVSQISFEVKGYHRFHAERDLADIIKWLGGATTATMADAENAAKSNLPRLPCFFGRDDELARIADALKPEKEQLWGALIFGPGGFGKTSLAIHAASRALAFDRVLFLTAKARQLTAAGPKSLQGFVLPGHLQMLNEIAHLLGRPDLLQHPAPERASAVVHALRRERALLVLDNLETLADQDQFDLLDFVEHLPKGCKAILTARRFTLESGRLVSVGKLGKTAALSYLEELALDRPLLAKAERRLRVNLYEETGGNPLLIRWVVGQLGRGKCATIGKALAFLKKAPPDNDPLAFIFDDLVDALSGSEIKAIRGLSGAADPLDAKTLAGRAKLSRTAAYTVLNDLADRGLVNSDPTREFFSVLPVVVAYLNEILRQKK